jgi:protein involved in polysaccharide export with SLBB domain
MMDSFRSAGCGARLLASALILSILMSVSGCQTGDLGTTQSVTPVEKDRAGFDEWSDRRPTYRFNTGDKIRVFFERTPELNEVVLVGPDGNIGLRAAGRVLAAGLDAGDLEVGIARSASRILTNPIVVVSLDETAGSVFHVGGAVKEPGTYPLVGRIGVSEAIFRARGSDSDARLTEIVLIRRSPANRPMLRTIDLRHFVATADLSDDVPLAPGDIIYVPRSRIGELNLWIDQFINRVLPFNKSFSYVVQPAGGTFPF